MMKKRQNGVALLIAMLIIALAAIIGSTMLSQMNLALHRSGNVWQSQQAWWYAVGIENWVGRQLRRDAKYSKIDSLQEPWAKPVNFLPLDGGSLKGRVIDLQGRFNLNNLVLGNTKQARKQFARLITEVTDTDTTTAQTIASATKDWIDQDINPTRPGGAEDSYYLGLQPAYRTGDTLMVSPSELRLVKGVTRQIYQRLLPYICTLPAATSINVNTAPAAVLQSLIPNLPQSAGQTLVKQRKEKPWKSIGRFKQTAGQNLTQANLGVKTSFFRIQGQITVGQTQLRFYAILQRAANGATRLIRQSTNAY